MAHTFKGKALLVMDRLHTENPKDFRWDIHHCVFTGAGEDKDPGDEIGNAFWCMETDNHPAPAAAYKMAVGDRIRIAVTFEIHFSHDSYTGEWDCDMYLTRERVLRYQPYNERQYRKKYYQFWKETSTDKVKP